MTRSITMWTRMGALASVALLQLAGAIPSPAQDASSSIDGSEPPISLGFLGMYRKTMEIEEEITRHSQRYGVDPVLARAICLYESGGNGNLTSQAGAKGYFQVMPSTFRLLGVKTNIEAGIKYFSQMMERFEREEIALAGYNGGPGHVLRGRPMRMETLQYVIGISYYKNILRDHEEAVRRAASDLSLHRVVEGDTWWQVSQKTGRSLLLLRMHNPFLASRVLREGQTVALPAQGFQAPVALGPEELGYTARLGDVYLNLAFVFGVTPDQIREANGLWRVDLLLPGTPISIPVLRDAEWVTLPILPGDDIGTIAARSGYPEWAFIRDNGLWDQSLDGRRQVRVDPKSRVPTYSHYTVRRGDTLSGIAGRHGISLQVLRKFNGMSSGHWRIHSGQVLRIPIS